MPAVEAGEGAGERERASYELAFHVLPTIAEGEVPAVFQKVKDIVTKRGGEITVEEAPARFDLAYEIVKHLEGRNRKFSSAYFGWVRFSAEPESVLKIAHDIEGVKDLLRHLIIKLNKVEEENPFYFHEALSSQRKVENINIDDEEVVAEEESGDGEKEKEPEEESEAEKNGESDEDKV